MTQTEHNGHEVQTTWVEVGAPATWPIEVGKCERCSRKIETNCGPIGRWTFAAVRDLGWVITDDGLFFCPTHADKPWPVQNPI